ncbi:S-type pyocin domain-containing protein [Pseudomonas helleri]|uniref:S-type pyocin domain-containing protein n=1 Tax=Pseudomonas helleri TaxID=1608996 RepID=UPI003FD18356
MNEQIRSLKAIDHEYSARLNLLLADTQREWEAAKQAAKENQVLTPAEALVREQKATLDLIASKISRYATIAPAIYGLYSLSPYFLMEVLPRQKMSELLNSGNTTPESLMDLYALFDTVYKSAMELKVLSLSIADLAGKLAEQAQKIEQAQTAETKLAPSQQLEIITQERDIHAQQLPENLYSEFIAAAGAMDGMSPAQALGHYRSTLEHMAASKMAAVNPAYAPPSFSSGGVTVHFPVENPNIKAPLSKPELEALHELVYLQGHTEIGTKWQSYHDALLKVESARHLTATAKALGALAERANQVEQALETQRLAAEAAEQARLAAEAEAKRVADEQARAAEAIRVANAFKAPGPASASSSLFLTPAGTAAVIDTAAVTLQAAIRSSIAAITGLAAGTGFFVGVSALVYSSKLANGELPERYAFSTPLSDLISHDGQNLWAIAASGGSVDLPVRISSKTAADGQSEVFVAKADGRVVPSNVKVVAATFNAEQNVYSVTTEDVPPRTLTWTPIVNPGNSSTTLPAEPTAPPVYTGVTVTPVEGRIDTFPGLAEAGFDDFITVFPADSGLPALYVMFKDRREDPGVATGAGQAVTGIWLGAASQGEGAPIPSQIADQLRGREFRNFRAFREAFWKAVANDFELAKQFSSVNLARMKLKGYSPYAAPSEQVGGQMKFEIHHVVFLKNDGGVFDVDNMRVVTPKEHVELHK